MRMKQWLKFERVLGVVLAASAGALVLAWIAEYGFKLKPCELCLFQRMPYMVAAVLSLAGLLLIRKTKRRMAFLLLLALLMAGEALLAFYHVGVERKWVEGPSSCAGDSGADQSVEDLRAQIYGAQAIRCDEPQLKFLGLTMAGANAIYALLLALYLLAAAFQDRRHGRNIFIS